MAQIDKWKCDICKKEFGENDTGYANKKEVDIEINLGIYESIQTFYFEDTCKSCRDNIYSTVFDAIYNNNIE